MPRIITQDGTVIHTQAGGPARAEPYRGDYRSPDLPPPASGAGNRDNSGIVWVQRLDTPPVKPDCDCPLCNAGYPVRMG